MSLKTTKQIEEFLANEVNVGPERNTKLGQVSFDTELAKNDVDAARLFLSRFLGERIIIENIQCGNRPPIGNKNDAPRNGSFIGWNNIHFMIEYFNGDLQLCEAKFDGKSLLIEYGDFI